MGRKIILNFKNYIKKDFNVGIIMDKLLNIWGELKKYLIMIEM
jgi:hypothetical protein